RHAPALLRRRLGGADVHAAVHLHRIAADDFAAERLRDVEAEGRLAHRRRADQHEKARFCARVCGSRHGSITPYAMPELDGRIRLKPSLSHSPLSRLSFMTTARRAMRRASPIASSLTGEALTRPRTRSMGPPLRPLRNI